MASSALEPSYYLYFLSYSRHLRRLPNCFAQRVGHSQCFDDNQLRYRRSLAYCAPRDRIGLSSAPTTVGIEPEMRTNILSVNRPTPLRTAALRLTPLNTDMPNTGPSTRTSHLIKRAAPVTQRTLRYLRRKLRREVEEENSSRLIDSNCVRSTDPGSISYTHHLDEISPVQMRPYERAPQRPLIAKANTLLVTRPSLANRPSDSTCTTVPTS